MSTSILHLSDEQAEAIRLHMLVLRSLWMLSGRRPLSQEERGMLMDAIECVESAVDPDVDYEEDAP